MNIKGVILPWMQGLLLFSEQEVSSFHPSLGTDCSAGGLGRAGCPVPCGQLQLPLFIPQITTQIQTLTSSLILQLLCIGRVTTFHLLVRQQSPKSHKVPVCSTPQSHPSWLCALPSLFCRLRVSELPQSLQEERISTLHILSRASSVSRGAGKAPSLSLLLHKSPLPKQNPATKLMFCLHRPNPQPGELGGIIPSQDHWYVGASSA